MQKDAARVFVLRQFKKNSAWTSDWLCCYRTMRSLVREMFEKTKDAIKIGGQAARGPFREVVRPGHASTKTWKIPPLLLRVYRQNHLCWREKTWKRSRSTWKLAKMMVCRERRLCVRAILIIYIHGVYSGDTYLSSKHLAERVAKQNGFYNLYKSWSMLQCGLRCASALYKFHVAQQPSVSRSEMLIQQPSL